MMKPIGSKYGTGKPVVVKSFSLGLWLYHHEMGMRMVRELAAHRKCPVEDMLRRRLYIASQSTRTRLQ